MPTYNNEIKTEPSENSVASNGSTDPRQTEYEKVKADLRNLLSKKRNVDKSLNTLEEQLYKMEGAYLEDTPNGNVVKGFDNYNKGTQPKKRTGLSEQDRVFSLSSAVFLKAKMKEEDDKN